MIEIQGLYQLPETLPAIGRAEMLPVAAQGAPEHELLIAFESAGIRARVEGAGVSPLTGERDVEVWADTDEDTAWRIIDGLIYSEAWDIEGEQPTDYQPGFKTV